MNTYEIVSSNGNITSYVRSDVPPAKFEIIEATCTIPSFDHNDPNFDIIDEVVAESVFKLKENG